MKKTSRIVMITVIFLFIATAGLWLLNGGGIATEDTGAVIVFKEDGEAVAEADMEYITGLAGETFKAVTRSDGQKPVEAEYKGVLLKDLLGDMGIGLDGKTQVTVSGADGYMWAIALSELDERDVYIAYEMNGKPLKSKIKNGSGPFQLIIPDDRFSQRWCKYVCEVEVK